MGIIKLDQAAAQDQETVVEQETEKTTENAAASKDVVSAIEAANDDIDNNNELVGLLQRSISHYHKSGKCEFSWKRIVCFSRHLLT